MGSFCSFFCGEGRGGGVGGGRVALYLMEHTKNENWRLGFIKSLHMQCIKRLEIYICETVDSKFYIILKHPTT